MRVYVNKECNANKHCTLTLLFMYLHSASHLEQLFCLSKFNHLEHVSVKNLKIFSKKTFRTILKGENFKEIFRGFSLLSLSRKHFFWFVWVNFFLLFLFWIGFQCTSAQKFFEMHMLHHRHVADLCVCLSVCLLFRFLYEIYYLIVA